MPAPAPIKILGIPVHPVTYESTLDLFGEWIASGQPHQVCTANPEFVMQALRQPNFAAVLRSAALCLPDGVGLLWAGRRIGQTLPERVAGSSMLYRLAERASQHGWRIFLLGAAEGVAAQTAERLTTLYPGVQFVGTYAGSPAESTHIVQLVRTAQPDILLVAFGAPKQDLWLAQYFFELQVPVMMGVGGSFDFVAGVTQRAPLWMQNLGLEWLHRLIRQPWRWRRMLDLPRFVMQVLLKQASATN